MAGRLVGLGPFDPVANVAPLTYRDGDTYLSILEKVRDNLDTHTDAINTNVDAINAVGDIANNAAQSALDAANSAAGSAISADQAAHLVNAPADEVMAAALSSPDSLSGQAVGANPFVTSKVELTDLDGLVNAQWVRQDALTNLGNVQWARVPENARNNLTGWFHANGFGLSTAKSAVDNDAALATVIAAMKEGDVLSIPAGVYNITKFPTLTKAIQIVGSGAHILNKNVFGHASWNDPASLSGTIFKCSTDIGVALEVDKVASTNNIRLENFILLGTGLSGSTGLRLGPSGGIGYPVRVRLNNVVVANFGVGVEAGCENSTLIGLYVVGCLGGMHTIYPFNGNTIIGVDIEHTSNYALTLEASDTNAWIGGVLQANKGSGVTLASGSYGNEFTSLYLENFGPDDGTGFDELVIDNGQFNTFERCHFGSDVTKKPRIKLNASANRNMIRVQGSGAKYVPYDIICDAASSRNRVIAQITGTITDNGKSNVIERIGDDNAHVIPFTTTTGSLTININSADFLTVMTGGGQTMTLPDPATVTKGRVYTIKNGSGNTNNTVTSAGAGKTVDGQAVLTFAAWECKRFISDGSNWLTV